MTLSVEAASGSCQVTPTAGRTGGEARAASGMAIIPVDADMARRVGDAYAAWGKGIHPAGLNFGDCFAYALAQSLGAPLLYVGADFTVTDCRAAL